MRTDLKPQILCALPAAYPPVRRCAGNRAFTLTEVLIGVALLGIIGVVALQSLNVFNRMGSESRLMSNARYAVQARIDEALTQDFNPPAGVVPGALELAPPEAPRTSPVTLLSDTDGSALVSGTLTEVVTSEPNPTGMEIRRLRATIDYSFGGRDFSYTATTLRGQDPPSP